MESGQMLRSSPQTKTEVKKSPPELINSPSLNNNNNNNNNSDSKSSAKGSKKTDSSYEASGRKRTARACDRCSLARTKCDGKNPCYRCASMYS